MSPPPVRVWESSLKVYRRVWVSNVLGSFVQPLLYLLGMGVGVGTLVDDGAGNAASLGGSYFAFFAPALIATTAMFATANEGMWPVMDGFMWSNAYRSMAATPLRPVDIVNGQALWMGTRAGIAATGVASVLALFDETRSWGLIGAVAAAVLTGLAFGMPLAAWSSTRHIDQSFPAIMRFVITPMFLFAGAFYPVDQLPTWLHPIAYATPLWHGVQLTRGAALGTLGLGASLGHLAVLAGCALIGWAICIRTFTNRLAQ